MPSISFLRKILSGKIDTIKAAQRLLKIGSISRDYYVILIFDEMYLQKSEEFSGGESIGADEDGELFKDVVCFIIVGLQSNVPCIIKASPEKTITWEWIKCEVLECLKL